MVCKSNILHMLL